jgi:hypothetical protein
MRTHQQIIAAANGPTALARQIGLEDAGPVHQWVRNNSIPAHYWTDVVEAGAATLEELAAAAKARGRKRGADQASAA